MIWDFSTLMHTLFGVGILFLCVWWLMEKIKTLPYWLCGKETDDYCCNVCVKETKVQEELKKRTFELSNWMMISSPVTQKLVQILLSTIEAKRAIDVGVFTGYSSLSTALVLPEDGEVYALEYDAKIIEVAKKYWKKAGVEDKVKIHIGKAGEILDDLIKKEGRTFDYAFIDANKDQYKEYYEKCLKLVRKGGFIVLDNMLWKGLMYRTDLAAKIMKRVAWKKLGNFSKGVDELNRYVAKDVRVESVLLPIDDGVTICRVLI